MSLDNERIIETLAVLSAEYPNTTLTKANYKAYVLVLQDLPLDLVVAACRVIATEDREFFPPAGVIRDRAVKLIMQQRDVPDSYEAWRQIKKGGYNAHPLAKKAIDALGGQGAFGQSDIDDEPSWRARFIQAYETIAKRETDDIRMLPEVKDFVKQLKAEQVDTEIKKLLSGMAGDDVGELPY
jgi:hypothetical protein